MKFEMVLPPDQLVLAAGGAAGAESASPPLVTASVEVIPTPFPHSAAGL